MTLSDFYTMSYDFKRGALTAEYVGDSLGNVHQLLRGEVAPPPELFFRQKLGTQVKDFVGTTHATPTLISQRVVNLLVENTFTGWKIHPVRLYLRVGVVHCGHFLLVVTGKSGPVNQSKAPVISKPPMVPGGEPYSVTVGLHFDPATWDGHDMFVPENWGAVIVTKAVRDCLTSAKVTNVHFEKCSELERDLFLRDRLNKGTN